jgi:hypothetical protein
MVLIQLKAFDHILERLTALTVLKVFCLSRELQAQRVLDLKPSVRIAKHFREFPLNGTFNNFLQLISG